MVPIRDIIEGVRNIPHATWIAGDPLQSSVRKHRRTPTVTAVSGSPALDDTNFEIRSRERWNEFTNQVSSRVAPSDNDGRRSPASGMDALAWYCSFHCHKEEEWGIYVPLSSVPLLDERYFANLRMDRVKRWRLIWDHIVSHELMHFYVDRAVAWFELMYHVPVRKAQIDRATKLAGHPLHAGLEYIAMEEALANGHAIRQLKSSAKAVQAVHKFIELQPAGYRDGFWASTDEGYRAALTETIRTYLVGFSSGWNIDLGHPALDLDLILPTSKEIGSECPIRIMDDLEAVGLGPDAVRAFSNVAPIEEGKKFPKFLSRLQDNHVNAWHRLKQTLSTTIPSSADFKKWPKGGEGIWSVRVTRNIRAHLQWQGAGQPWLAETIGTHKEMGHD